MTDQGAARRRGRPASISRDDILDEVDRRLDSGWTVATVAADLGVSSSAIYHYFPTRSAILTALSDRMFAELEAPTTDDWRAWLVEFALRWRDLVLRHSFMADLTHWPLHVRTAQMERVEPGLAVLTKAGFSLTDAHELILASTALSQVYATTEINAASRPIGEVPTLPPLLERLVEERGAWDPEQALRNAIGLLSDGAALKLGSSSKRRR